MKIILENTGRRFNREWIFRKVNQQFDSGNCYGIVGSNGSGKSTFVQLLSGFLTPSEGTVLFYSENEKLNQEDVFRHVSLCSPFMELYDDLTIEECFSFHASLKKMRGNISQQQFIEVLELKNILNKPIKNYSSGMRQRVKLALAILSDTSLLLLDEPCTNLDANTIQWYQQLLEKNASGRLIFVSSNHNAAELFLCKQQFNIEDYKQASTSAAV